MFNKKIKLLNVNITSFKLSEFLLSLFSRKECLNKVGKITSVSMTNIIAHNTASHSLLTKESITI